MERIWKPLLATRFDGDPSGLPATYLWARTRRMSGARDSKGSGGEAMGHIVGGHQRLIDAMVARAEELGVEILTDAPGQRSGDRRGRLDHRRRARRAHARAST